MRITNHRVIEQVVNNIQNRYERLAAVQQQLSTGRRVEKPSDDPGAVSEIMALDSQIRRGKQWMRNLDNGIASMQFTENSLNQVQELLVRVRASGIEGANDTVNSDDRRAIAEEIDQQLRELSLIANRRHGNRYVFGGCELNRTPYNVVENEDGWVTEIVNEFNQPANAVEQIIGENTRMEISLPGDDVFDLGEGESMFGILIDLREALTNDDADAVGDVLPRIDVALEQISSLTASIGSRIGTAQTISEQLTELEDQYTERVSILADADIVATITHLREEESAYEMALSTAAKVIQPSLVYFL